jgi:hypothetical protein
LFTNSADKKQDSADFFNFEPEPAGPTSRGYLVVAVVMLIIYALNPRPELYGLLEVWLRQLWALLGGVGIS